MSVRDIRILGDEVLRQKADETEITPKLRTLITDLFDTMYAAEGIGLAAPQVGVSLRVFVYDTGEEDLEPGVLVNPRIISSSGSVGRAVSGTRRSTLPSGQLVPTGPVVTTSTLETPTA